MSGQPFACVLSDINFGRFGGLQLYSPCHNPQSSCPQPTSGPGSMHLATAPVINVQAHYRPSTSSNSTPRTPDISKMNFGRKRGDF